mmetsp:Transcript_43362/g.41785  ORF Transcript_43362/g.41785 Transcript_43362/m.41785 type:complete len:83 (-) Transcript_43362:100-348(-)
MVYLLVAVAYLTALGQVLYFTFQRQNAIDLVEGSEEVIFGNAYLAIDDELIELVVEDSEVVDPGHPVHHVDPLSHLSAFQVQ